MRAQQTAEHSNVRLEYGDNHVAIEMHVIDCQSDGALEFVQIVHDNKSICKIERNRFCIIFFRKQFNEKYYYNKASYHHTFET